MHTAHEAAPGSSIESQSICCTICTLLQHIMWSGFQDSDTKLNLKKKKNISLLLFLTAQVTAWLCPSARDMKQWLSIFPPYF